MSGTERFTFEGIRGHVPILRVLERALVHPAHAYLFWGPSGVGKKLVAERFVGGLLEEASTLRAANPPSPLIKGVEHFRPPDKGVGGFGGLDAHPDFIRVCREEGAKEIIVKQARELVARMHLTSARGGRKVALIEQAERLNEEAANALLKAVEEPDANAVYIFVAEQPDRLPATLRSRLVSIAFNRVPSQSHEEPSRDEEATKILSTLALAPLGVQCAALERLAAEAESHEDSESAWREQLTQLMRASGTLFRDHPREAVRVGLGLIHAWHLAGSSLSPRLALEWAAARPYLEGEQEIFSFLQSRYL